MAASQRHLLQFLYFENSHGYTYSTFLCGMSPNLIIVTTHAKEKPSCFVVVFLVSVSTKSLSKQKYLCISLKNSIFV